MTPPTDQQLAELQAIADRHTADPFFVSDCEGSLQVWREKALVHVTRDEAGVIDMYSFPSSYRPTDQVIELDLDSWDPGEDAVDDQRRQDIGDLVDARAALGGLLDEIGRLQAALAAEQAQHAFTLRQRNNRSERLNYLRDIAESGQTELLAEEALNTLAASINDHMPADGDEMAASLRRDGFGADEIADMLGPGVTEGEAVEPVQLRWGLDDVQYGDDGTITVMLSDPARKPYWLELDRELAAVLRANLAGPDGEQRRVLTPNEYDAAWHAVEGGAGEEGADPGTILHAVLDRLGIAWQDAAHPAAVETHIVADDSSDPTPAR